MWGHLQHITEQCIDLCFPPTKEALVVRSLSPSDIHVVLSPAFKNEIWCLSSFQHPDVRALIHEAKFHGSTRACSLLGEMVIRFCVQHPALLTAVWIPIPLSSARLRARGYNQTELILKSIQADEKPILRRDILARARDTTPQTELARAERLTNLAGAFTVLRPEEIQEKHIILFDDVTTTGSTLKEARKTILEHNPKSVTLVALAH
jgi:ComF family protein